MWRDQAVDTSGHGDIGLQTRWAILDCGHSNGSWTRRAEDTVGHGHRQTHLAMNTPGHGHSGQQTHWVMEIALWTHLNMSSFVTHPLAVTCIPHENAKPRGCMVAGRGRNSFVTLKV